MKCVMVPENSIGMATERHSYYLDSAAKTSLSTHSKYLHVSSGVTSVFFGI